MSLAQFWATLRAAWLSIALMVVVATGVAGYVAAGLPKQYTAKARVMLNIDNPDPTQFSALQRGTTSSYVATQMRLAADLGTTRVVAEKLGWPDSPQVIAAWQAATGGKGDPTTWAAHLLSQGIAVQQLEDSSIIEIYYSSSSLEVAKQIVAVIRAAYIEQDLKLRVEAARRAAAWNEAQATRALAALQHAEAARVAFMTANQIPLDTARGGLDYAAQATTMANSLAAANATGRAVATPEDPAVTRLRRRLDGLDAEIAVVRLRGGDASPALVALTTQRTEVAQQLARELAVGSAGGGATTAQIDAVRQQRDADYLAARLRLIERAPLYDRLAALDRDIALKTQRYAAAAARGANFATVAAAPSGLQVIGDVIASDDPSYPNITLMMAVAAGASFALATALALVGELVRRQVRGAEDLHFFAAVPVLAVIARDPPPHGRFARRLSRFRVGRWRAGNAVATTTS